VPIGSFATLNGDQITLRGLVASLDGKTMYKKELTDLKTNAVALGRRMGDELIEMGAGRIMQEIKSD
jgi:hydroxymethylbilane synthase